MGKWKEVKKFILPHDVTEDKYLNKLDRVTVVQRQERAFSLHWVDFGPCESLEHDLGR